MDGIARSVVAVGFEAERVASELVSGLRGEGLRLVVVFIDWRIDAGAFARAMQQALPAPVVGCTTIGVIGGNPDVAPSAAAIGLYGDWLRIGIGVATELPKSALARSRDAVHTAASALGTTAEALTSARHVAFTFVDGSSGNEEAFCIASAATAPQIRFVGGSAATEIGSKDRRAYVFANGEALADAGIVVLLETKRAFEAITSQHMMATSVKTVVTAADGREIQELDGRPAADRLRELVTELGGTISPTSPSEFAFARFVDGVPYLRSIIGIHGNRVQTACAVETGHVLRLMRPGDLIGQTQKDLAATAERVGGKIDALLAFSCIGRHWEAAARGIEKPLAQVYAAYPTVGFQSFGEQTGMLLVNHTLTGLAIGGMPQDGD
jgi:hypothetical protein